ncbi:CotH kinase family protein [Cellulomonas sp. KRMCY2]|uniref:CotH kinase family protein n=1 Tax=Cellulomonas sp. KRMCY2 TaxID=1304865 RepID=UPI0009DF58C1|nr:CotH kinase family protein [Cellulomonas sp. KRMCY2]
MSHTPLPRRHWSRATAVVLATTVSLGALTSCTTSPSPGDAAATDGSAVTTTAGSLFDSSQVHDVAVTFDEADYTAMIEAYTSTGDKSWISATVTVDGVVFEEVGLRLKGNSSLRGVSADADPTTMPWLVRLDKYVDGQELDGVTSFVVRSSTTTTALNEAVALELIGLSGLATQRATPTRFSINGGDAVLRLVIENPDDTWAEAVFDTDGVLYKSEAEGSWAYQGDDPESYAESFDQETGDEEDLTPLIGFLEWLDTSDDATFAAELTDHLDVDAFATYLAVQDLVDNFDDISGPGNNSYLRYDAETGVFTVVSWDQNLSFGTMGGGGMPGEAGAGREMPEGMTFPEGATPPEGFDPPDATAVPDGVAPTDGIVPTDGPTLPGGGGEPPAGFEPGGRMGQDGGLGGNVLAERFMADDGFAALYDAALAGLTASLYDSGTAADVLATWTEVLTSQASDLVDAGTITQEAAAIATYWE